MVAHMGDGPKPNHVVSSKVNLPFGDSKPTTHHDGDDFGIVFLTEKLRYNINYYP